MQSGQNITQKNDKGNSSFLCAKGEQVIPYYYSTVI